MRSTAEVSVQHYMIEERWRCSRREQDVRKWQWETLEQTLCSLFSAKGTRLFITPSKIKAFVENVPGDTIIGLLLNQ